MFLFSILKKEEQSATETVRFNYHSAVDIKANKLGNVHTNVTFRRVRVTIVTVGKQ